MKKKWLLWIGLGILCICLIVFYFVFRDNKKFITIDINPSLELQLTKDNKVSNMIAINKDGEGVIDDEWIGKKYDTVLKELIKKSIEMGFIENDLFVVLVHSNTDIDFESFKNGISPQLEKDYPGIDFKLEVIEKVSSLDKKLAKKYNVNPAKIAYARKIAKDNKNLDLKSIVEKSVSELQHMSEENLYCEEGYTLRGDSCWKEKERIEATAGQVCPADYTDYNGVCYENGKIKDLDTFICHEGEILKGEKCVNREITDVIADCGEGEYRIGEDECSKRQYIGDGVEYCRITPGEDLYYNGRCLGRKPTINGGCLGSDVVIGGYCYDTSPTSGYEGEYLCPNGALQKLSDGPQCYEMQTYAPSSYSCPKGYQLDGKTCYVDRENSAEHEISCLDGSTLVGYRTCLNLQKTAPKEDGFICDYPDSRMEGNTCILYERKDALVNS